ncbi:50S ribosomal protein L32 [Candidatus Kuenenbacteria bacterium CG_4_9_14_3_um_filter_39_14]|uniref:Large ribosomal subunit protein bL32 n=6 Tax=Candidatus Kueneniibacteriota TaxID=1752740 RepID=A0A2M7ILX4_9BACT|nr:50S ribosomal protein L32 [Candidatus Kuenenbacteria bacterium]OIP55769.1 MAG: 50S ribosomal protein L32 [Candidatus Kuenenbacteria bacterium CG2_30_39_24]PIP76075.1 MAG: 50S ribosomal protein L32 [Candidatus Kuenenbacteria bacterium CG22_combo_CG10-13_8_21_14_all_39_9]PIR80582.1 MAG: 50S ribosomal protein L32 [Candidatus Kuenenbacteria bacterium CG10_big_fil_rev_8_21_14_0_10_39_14]PIW95859.1 MAG: 50S ribosomal protein L32 [Candidatus Kuenenbacteria bacterium CG_4_8_14_3_um_filter_39_15]PIX
MPTPTQKHTSSRKKVRRGQLQLKKINLSVCPKCKKPVRPHRACANCGTYRGHKAFKVKVPKKLRKKSVKGGKEEKKK